MESCSACGKADAASFCCGKTICDGCYFCLTSGRCPFCNTKCPNSQEEQNKRLMERIERYNDPVAMTQLGCYYQCGDAGFSVDTAKAVELFQRAIENGSSTAHYSLGSMYEAGIGVDIDMKKAVHHYEIAAMMGYQDARYNIGILEGRSGNINRARRHFMIAARCGHELSLEKIKKGFIGGLVTKQDFNDVLYCYKASCEDTKSEQRERAKVLRSASLPHWSSPSTWHKEK